MGAVLDRLWERHSIDKASLVPGWYCACAAARNQHAHFRSRRASLGSARSRRGSKPFYCANCMRYLSKRTDSDKSSLETNPRGFRVVNDLPAEVDRPFLAVLSQMTRRRSSETA